MYDKGKIIPGLIVFVLFMTYPIWKGVEAKIPNPEKPKGYTACVRDTAYMRSSHQQMLNQWRDEVVRTGNREQQQAAGKMYEKSLQNGCMKCHASKKKFCDECHLYTAVNPYCWDCHIAPKETM